MHHFGARRLLAAARMPLPFRLHEKVARRPRSDIEDWDSITPNECSNRMYARVPRLRLDADRRWWPPPPGPRLGHYGVLSADSALDPPEGFRWCSPRFSKRR